MTRLVSAAVAVALHPSGGALGLVVVVVAVAAAGNRESSAPPGRRIMGSLFPGRRPAKVSVRRGVAHFLTPSGT